MVKASYKPYCVKCKAKVQPENPKISTTATGRKVLKGECPTCHTKLNRFLASSDTKESVGL